MADAKKKFWVQTDESGDDDLIIKADRISVTNEVLELWADGSLVAAFARGHWSAVSADGSWERIPPAKQKLAA